MEKRNLFIELETGDINKVIVPAGKFTLSDVFSVALLKMVNPNIQYIRKDKVEPEDLKAKDTIVVNIGGDIYDYHQPFFAQDNTNRKMTGFRLLWKDLGEDICGYKDLAEFIENVIVEQIDYASTDGLINRDKEPDQLNPFDIRNIINWLLPNWNEELEDIGYDSIFETSMVMAFYTLSNSINAYNSREKAVDIIRSKIEEEKLNTAVVFDNDKLPPIILEYARSYINDNENDTDELYIIIKTNIEDFPEKYKEKGQWYIYYCNTNNTVHLGTTLTLELALKAVKENKAERK